MPSADIAPGLAAVSQAFGLTIQDTEAPSKVNGDAKVSNETNGNKVKERYVNYCLVAAVVLSSSIQPFPRNHIWTLPNQD